MSTTIPTDITDNADADPCPEHGTCTCTTGTRCDECAADLALLAGVRTSNLAAHADWIVEVSGSLPEYTGWDGQRFTPALVGWQREYHHGEDYGTRVLIYDSKISTSVRFDAGDAVPAWVPRPPKGWDAGVAAVIASLAAS